MLNKAARTTEYQISIAVLRYLRDRPNREASYGQIRAALPNYVQLTDGDMEYSPTRPGERRWEQIVRNIQSHKDNPNNFIYLGYLENAEGGGLRATDKGLEFIKP